MYRIGRRDFFKQAQALSGRLRKFLTGPPSPRLRLNLTIFDSGRRRLLFPASGLPVAILRYRVNNPGSSSASVGISFSIDNPVKAPANTDVARPTEDPRVNEYRTANGLEGLLMTNPSLAAGDPMQGSFALAVVESGNGRTTHWRGWPQQFVTGRNRPFHGGTAQPCLSFQRVSPSRILDLAMEYSMVAHDQIGGQGPGSLPRLSGEKSGRLGRL